MGFGQIQGAYKRDREGSKETEKQYLYRSMYLRLIKNAVIPNITKRCISVIRFRGRREYFPVGSPQLLLREAH